MTSAMSGGKSDAEIIAGLAEEFVERYRRGERPPVSEYTAQHPELAEEIREFFSVVAMVENLAPVESESFVDADASVTSGTLPELSQLGDFRIIREVGRGGMAVVYEAEQVSLGRHVALKVLPSTALPDDKHIRRFEREAKSAARLHHTNIVPVFGVGAEQDLHYYVMQFIQGLPLDDVIDELKRIRAQPSGTLSGPVWVRETGAAGHDAEREYSVTDMARSLITGRFPRTLIGASDTDGEAEDTHPKLTRTAPESVPQAGDTTSSRLSETLNLSGASSGSGVRLGQSGSQSSQRKPFTYWESVANIGVQVADAMQYAHDQGILHRDIKPSNLLLDMRGTAWVTDFGLAKATDQQDITHTGDILGTLRYMPPEAFDGMADPRSDVYSLGLTLYELLCFQPAFGMTDRNRLVKQVTTEAAPRLEKLNPEIPRDLVTIIHKAIDREPSHRYQTARELEEDLQRFLDDEPIRARRVSTTERLARWSRRNKGLAASLAALCVLLLVINIAGPAMTWHMSRLNTNLNNYIFRLQQTQDELKDETQRASDQAAAARKLADANEDIALRESDARAEADRQRLMTRRVLYSSAVFAAQHTISTPDGYARARELLDEVRPQSGEKDLRGWEWYYLHAQPPPGGVILRSFARYPTTVAFNPDGKMLATGDWSGEVNVFDAESGRLQRTFAGPRTAVSWVAWNPDGTRIASVGADRTVHVWNVKLGTEELQLSGHDGWVAVVAWSPDGRYLVTGGLDGLVKTWDAMTGDNLLTIRAGTGGVRGVDWSRDGRWLVSGGDDQKVHIWGAESGTEIRALERHTSAIARVRFSPDSRRIASSCLETPEKAVIIWDAEQGIELLTLSYPTAGAHGVSWSPDGSKLATAGWKNETADVWDADSGEHLNSFVGHLNRVYECSWSPDGRRLASVSADKTVRVWDVVKEEPAPDFAEHTDRIDTLDWSPDGSRLATGSSDRTVKIWDLATRQNLLTFDRHTREVHQIDWDPEGTRLVSCGDERVFQIWEAETGRVLHTINATTTGDIHAVAWSPDGGSIASAGDDGTVRVFDVETEEEVRRFDLEFGVYSHGIDWSDDSGRLAAAANSGDVIVWNVDSGDEIAHFLKREQEHYVVRFSLDGTKLAAGGERKPQESIFDNAAAGTDGTITIWDLETARELRRLHGHSRAVRSLDWSKDGARLLSAGDDGRMILWDTATGAQLIDVQASRHQPVLATRFSPDELTIATAGDAPGVRLWDATAGYAAEFSTRLLDALELRIAENPAFDDLKLHGEILAKQGQWEQAAEDFDSAAHLTAGGTREVTNRWFTSAWWVTGPYPGPLDTEQPPESNLDPFAPVPGVSTNGVVKSLNWEPAVLGADQGLILGRFFHRAEQISGYAQLRVYSPTEQSVAVLFGADDALRLWFNGELLHNRQAPRTAVRDDEGVDVTLQPGWNILLAKVFNSTGDHGLFLRLSDDPLTAARVFARNEKWAEALAWWDRAYAERPEDPEVLLGRGRAALGVGRADVAAECFDAVLADNEPFAVRDVASAYARHAHSLIAAGRATEASDSLARARTLYEALLSDDAATEPDAANLAEVLLADTTRWSVLEPAELSSAGGTRLTPQDDGSILPSGDNPDSEIYTIVSDVPLDNISALRLEVLPHPEIHNGATGRGKAGLFTLTEVTASICASGDAAQPEALVFDSACASYDYSDKTHNIRATIDGQRDNRLFWNTYPHPTQPATAFFEIAPSIVHGPHSRLTINLDFHHKDWTQNNLGCFRLAVTNDPAAFRSEGPRLAAMKVPEPWLKLGAAYSIEGDSEAAARCYARALDGEPDLSARSNLVKQIVELQPDLSDLAALRPDDPLLLQALAQRQAAAGQSKSAAESMARARASTEALLAQSPADEALAGFLADLSQGDAPILRLIPRPRDLTVGEGSLTFTTDSRIVATDPVLTPLAGILSDEIFTVTGVRMLPAEGHARAGDVTLQIDRSLKDEAYRIDVGDQAVVRGSDYPAVASATVTLLQALQSEEQGLALPKLAIADRPAYPYRAALIDLARQYHTPGGIEQVIELCRLYKLRYLQLHLSDDQLFMFPSTAFPQAGTTNQELTRFEPPSKPRIEPYSIGKLRHLEQFASARGVYLVPELDLPGHSGRLVGDVPEPFGFPGNGSTINIASPETLAAVETLLNEVMDVFQSTPYIHLGADEVGLGGLEQTLEYKALQDGEDVKSPHDVYCRFVADLVRIVAERGKQAIVWEEAWNARGAHPLPKDVVVMVWSQGRNPSAIVDSGYPVVNATWTPLYIRRENKKSLAFLHQWDAAQFGREGSEQFTTLQDTGGLLGAQLCSWENSECMEIQSMRDRLALVAERTWNPQAGGDLAEFQTRLAHTDAILNRLIHPVAVEVQGEFTGDENTFAEPITITLTPRQDGLTLRYTLDNSLPGPGWHDYTGPIVVDKTVHLRAGLFDANGELRGNLVGGWFRGISRIEPNLATHKPVTVGPGPDRDDRWSSRAAVDGRADDAWAHWASTDPAPQWLQIDLEQVYPVDFINVITFYDRSRYYQWNAEVSVDGKTWHKVLDFSTNEVPATAAGYSGTFPATDARYVRINVLRNSANPWVHIVEVIVKAREQPADDGERQP